MVLGYSNENVLLDLSKDGWPSPYMSNAWVLKVLKEDVMNIT